MSLSLSGIAMMRPRARSAPGDFGTGTFRSRGADRVLFTVANRLYAVSTDAATFEM
jgi:hypothetical protein